jgi:hypothetical protein
MELRWTPEAAVKYPLVGRVGREAGTRELGLAPMPHIVVYRIRDTGIEILRHGARNRILEAGEV